MLLTSASAAFILGLGSGVHCAAMCGGVVTALSLRSPPQPSRCRFAPPGQLLAYNAGRLLSYCLGGAVAGALGSLIAVNATWAPVQQSGYLIISLLLFLQGLYLLGFRQLLTPLEQLGRHLWRPLAAPAAKLLRANGTMMGIAAGLVWGLVPCALVYTMLLTALSSGSALHGALLMAAFGLGTLPNLLAFGWVSLRLAPVLRRSYVRPIAGALLIMFAVAAWVRIDALQQLGSIAQACLDWLH